MVVWCGVGPRWLGWREMEAQVGGKQRGWEGENETAEMVVEVTGETGEVLCEIDDLGMTVEMGETGEADKMKGVTGEVTSEMGEVMGQTGEPDVTTGELGDDGVEVSEWWPAPMKWCSKHKNVIKDVGESKIWRLEDAAAAGHISDGESYVSDCSEVSHTDSQESKNVQIVFA